MQRFKGYLNSGETYLRGQVVVQGELVGKIRMREEMQKRHDAALKSKRTKKGSVVATTWLADVQRQQTEKFAEEIESSSPYKLVGSPDRPGAGHGSPGAESRASLNKEGEDEEADDTVGGEDESAAPDSPPPRLEKFGGSDWQLGELLCDCQELQKPRPKTAVESWRDSADTNAKKILYLAEETKTRRTPMARDAANMLEWFGKQRLQATAAKEKAAAAAEAQDSEADDASKDSMFEDDGSRRLNGNDSASGSLARTEERLRFFRTARRIATGSLKGFDSSQGSREMVGPQDDMGGRLVVSWSTLGNTTELYGEGSKVTLPDDGGEGGDGGGGGVGGDGDPQGSSLHGDGDEDEDEDEDEDMQSVYELDDDELEMALERWVLACQKEGIPTDPSIMTLTNDGHLCFTDLQIGNRRAPALAAVLEPMRSITALDLANARLSGEPLGAIMHAACLNSLSRLNISGNMLGPGGRPGLKSLLSSCTGLHHLDLSRVQLTDEDVIEIMDAMVSDIHLTGPMSTSLEAGSSYEVRDKMGRRGPRITHLFLAGNLIGANDAGPIKKKDSKPLKDKPLKKKPYDPAAPFRRKLRYDAGKTISKKDLKRIEATDEKYALLGKLAAGAEGRVYEYLRAAEGRLGQDLDGCKRGVAKLSDAELSAVAVARLILRPTVKIHTIDLSWNSIGSYGAHLFFMLATECPSLEVLKLAGNSIGDHAAHGIAHFISHAPRCDVLDLSQNMVRVFSALPRPIPLVGLT